MPTTVWNNPLYKKLGIKTGYSLLILNEPKDYLEFFNDFPENILLNNNPGKEKYDLVHLFATSQAEFECLFILAKSVIKTNGAIWVSWPKKTSGVVSEIDMNKVKEFGIKTGLVDAKIASMDNIWSACKFVIRVKDR